MSRALSSVSLMLLALIAFATKTIAQEVPRTTAVERLRIAIPEERYRRAAQAWVSTVGGGDFGVAEKAIDDVLLAPPEIHRMVLDQIQNSGALLSLFKSLNRQNRQELIKDLLPYGKSTLELQNALGQELRSLDLSRDDLQYVTNISILLRAHSSLSDAVQVELIAAVSRDPSLHRLGLQLLLKRRLTIPTTSVDEALSDSQGELQLDALRYIASVPAQTLTPASLKITVPWFSNPDSARKWELTYDLFEAKDPGTLKRYFEDTKSGADQWRKSKPEVLVRILEVLPRSYDQTLASWELMRPRSGTELLADESRVNLLILLRRARAGRDISADLFNSIQNIDGSDAASMKSLLDLVNQVLLAWADGVQDFGKFLAARWQAHDFESFRNQVAALAGRSFEEGVPASQPTALVEALSPPLAAALRAGNLDVTRDLMRLNTPTDSDLLGSTAVLSNFRTKQQLSNETALDVLANFHHLPDDIEEIILSIAKDTSASPSLRQSAIHALGSQENESKYAKTFIQIAQETVVLPSDAALEELVPIYREASAETPVLSPNAGWLMRAASDESTVKEAGDLFAVLSARNRSFSSLLVQALGADVARHRCWDLLAPDSVPPEVWLSMLDSALRVQQLRDGTRACVSMIAPDQKNASVIALALNGEGRLVPQTSIGRRELFDALTEEWPHTSGFPVLRNEMASQVALLSSTLPYTPDSISQLRKWQSQVKAEAPQAAKTIGDEQMRREILVVVLGVPLLVLAHLILWIVLLLIYPHSPAIQSIIFWNPLVRKIVAFGYMDAVLLAVPLARRRIMAPFREQMLGEVLQPSEGEVDRLSYYPNARVRKLSISVASIDQVAEQPILEALATLQGRTVLLGASGLGKSSFLRFRLIQEGGPKGKLVIYLPAARCSGGVEKAIASRIHVFSLDGEMLRSLIHAGRLEIYIDGYNEVDLATQDEITSFTATFDKAKILVASQILLRGLSRLETLELQPLQPNEIEAFLTSRAAVLPDSAAIQGEDYKRLASSYLSNLWESVESDAEKRAYELVLSNPMDLTTTATALANGKEPSLLSLQEQQFEIMALRHLKTHGTPFRIEAFSEDLFRRSVAGDDDLTKSPFDREVGSLIAEKMAIVRAVEVRGRATQQEIRFRHDRIRDYFSHFAFLGDEHEERRLQYSKESRFAGVYEYLAKMLPPGPATRLKEYLLMRAVETQDHRLSDSFIRQMSWREQFALADPPWMSEFDFPAAQQADLEFDRLQSERKDVEQQLNAQREIMSSQRARTRILTAFDDDSLLKLAIDCLASLGAQATAPGKEGLNSVELRSPTSIEFSVAAVGSRQRISAFQIELLVQRSLQSKKPVLVVTNSQIDVPAGERGPDLSPEACARLRQENLFPCAAVDLYASLKRSVVAGDNQFWLRGDLPWKTASIA